MWLADRIPLATNAAHDKQTLFKKYLCDASERSDQVLPPFLPFVQNCNMSWQSNAPVVLQLTMQASVLNEFQGTFSRHNSDLIVAAVVMITVYVCLYVVFLAHFYHAEPKSHSSDFGFAAN